MSGILEKLFRHKAAADDELLTALARLPNDSAVLPLAIQALSHSYAVDRIFAAHMTGKSHGFASANPSQQPTLQEIAANLRESDREYVDYVSRLGCDQLSQQIDFTFTDGAPGRMSREEMLMHVITHGVGHRGQISALLLLNSLTPPRDGFTTYLHTAEGASRRRAA